MAWDWKMLDDFVRRTAVIGLLLFVAVRAEAQLVIEITEYAGKRTPVAVVPFGWEGDGETAPYDIAAVIVADLKRSGRFAPIAEGDMLQKPTRGVEVDFDDSSPGTLRGDGYAFGFDRSRHTVERRLSLSDLCIVLFARLVGLSV